MRIDSIRILLAITALEDLECEHLDVSNAFTESRLKEAIYMDPPPGLELKNGKVLKLHKSLYGLKQAARDWYATCSQELTMMS